MSTAALLVTDMQNAFCHRDGSFERMLKGTELSIDMCVAAVAPCAALVAGAREAGVPVIFTKYVYQRGYADRDVLLEKVPAIEANGALLDGSWDCEVIDDLVPGPNDYVIEKSRYSAFIGTRLEPLLDGLGVDTLVICGVTTNVCVETTARDAAQRRYQVIVVSDATGELTEGRHASALDILQYGFADVVDTREVLARWKGADL
jgi:ureidoacrylate peracid hydrolase